MKKRILSILLVIAMITGILPNEVFAVSVNGLRQDENGVYQIGTIDDLYAFAELVNNGETTANAILTNDIVVNTDVVIDGELASDTTNFKMWNSIGNSDTPYMGIFDGNNKKISGLYYKGDSIYIGLIGYMGSSGVVKNINIADSYFYGFGNIAGVVAWNEGNISECTVSGLFWGYGSSKYMSGSNVGGISGYNGGTILRCNNICDIHGVNAGGIAGNNASIISECSNFGIISGSDGGGIAGENEGTIYKCVNNSVISALYAGGILGRNNGIVEECTNSGKVCGSEIDDVTTMAGGIVSTNYAIIDKCSNNGTVSAPVHAGGIAVASVGENASITNSFNTGVISGSDCVGGIVGTNQNKSIIANCYSIGSINGGDEVGGIVGSNSSSVFNCYYLSENETDEIDGTNACDDFTTGKICYLLNGDQTDIIFRQNIDIDEYPCFTGNIVYEVLNCDGESTIYSNSNEKVNHDYENSICIVCGTSEDYSVRASGKCGDDLKWRLLDNGVLSITGTGEMYDYELVSESYLEVRSTAPWVAYKDEIVGLVIEEGVVSIGANAFYEFEKLEGNLKFPQSLIYIGESAFACCSGLDGNLELPQNLTFIGKAAFYECSGFSGNLVLPETVERIEWGAFYGCTGFHGELKLAKNLKYIGGMAFNECTGFTGKLVIPEGVEEIWEVAFGNMNKVTGEVVIPESVRYMDAIVFDRCDNLNKIIFLNPYTEIMDEKGLCVPSTIVSSYVKSTAHDYARKYGYEFEAIEEWGEGLLTYGECGDNLTWTLTEELVLTISGNGEMNDDWIAPWDDYKTEIREVVIEDGVTNIAANAFAGCINMTSVSIGKDVKIINCFAFDGCSKLESIVIPEGVEEIWEVAFQGCTSLKEITLPESLEHIDGIVFEACDGLEKVTFLNPYTEIFDDFALCPESTIISSYIKSTAHDYAMKYGNEFEAIEEWGEGLLTYGECGDNLTWTLTEEFVLTISGTGEMNDDSFKNCVTPWDEYKTEIKEVIIENGVTDIAYYAFAGCTNLTSVSIGADVKVINGFAFEGCPKLESVVIPEGVEEIWEVAFQGCTSLQEVELPESLVYLSEAVFTDCISLHDIVLPLSLESFSISIFDGCESLKEITIHKNISNVDLTYRSIGSTGLSSIYVEAENKYYSAVDGVLFDKNQETLYGYPPNKEGNSYKVPDGVRIIADNAFEGTALSNIELPLSLRQIGASAFSNGCDLKKIVIPCNVEIIKSCAFADNTVSEIRFTGKMPVFESNAFGKVEATVYYPTCWENQPTEEELGTQFGSALEWIPYENHILGVWEVEEAATCTQTGLETRKCFNCDYEENREIQVVNHNYNAIVTKATCIYQGYTTHTCSCGDSYVDNYKEATGHSLGAWEVEEAASCGTVGSEKRFCSNCDYEEEREVAAFTHNYEAVVKEPLCEEEGYTTHTCSLCGDSYVDNYKEALGHSYVNGICDECHLVRPDIVITQQPSNCEAKLGERFVVEVKADGVGLKYQWYFRNAGSDKWNKSGVKDNTYDDEMTKARAGRDIYCVITDSNGNSIQTDTAKLIAIPNEKLEIVTQPTNGEAALGERYCVTVEAKGDNIKYQWYFRNEGADRWSKSSVKDNTYDDEMTKARAGREVYCVITDELGNSVTTNTVKLICIHTKLEIITQPKDTSVHMGETFCATVEAKGDNLKYQWYFRNAGSDKWNKSGVKDNTYDDEMTKARAGREIYCVITDQWGESITTDTVKLIAIPHVELKILSQPSDVYVAMGEQYCVTVEAQGDDLTYQWYFRNEGADGWSKSSVKDNTYDDKMTKARANRQVYCVIKDNLGNQVTTDVVTLYVTK